MTITKEFDVMVIGSGSAGISAAEAAREVGAERVAIVEAARRLGGECPNRACVPTKALLRSAEALSLCRRAAEFGIKASRPSFQFTSIITRKRRIVDALTKPPRLEAFLKKQGITLIKGRAAFRNSLEIEISGKRFRAAKFIVATGSEPVVPLIDGLASAGYLTSADLIETKKIPESLLIIGGGPIGVEFAQIFAPFGSRVTIVEFAPQILSREEPEIAKIVRRSLENQGVTVFTNTKVTAVCKRRNRVITTITSAEEETVLKEITASHLLVAAGKQPAVGRLNLDAIGVRFDERGGPIVNEYLQTSVPNIYIAGDAAGHLQFTHVAHYEGSVAGKNAVLGNNRKIDLSVIPRGTFTMPEIGSVGITEAEARKKGFVVAVGAAAYAGFGKALVTGESDGLVKIIVDRNSKMILGGHVVGAAAAEIVHEIALAMFANVPYTTVAEMIHAYPTYAEAVGAAASNISQ